MHSNEQTVDTRQQTLHKFSRLICCTPPPASDPYTPLFLVQLVKEADKEDKEQPDRWSLRQHHSAFSSQLSTQLLSELPPPFFSMLFSICSSCDPSDIRVRASLVMCRAHYIRSLYSTTSSHRTDLYSLCHSTRLTLIILKLHKCSKRRHSVGDSWVDVKEELSLEQLELVPQSSPLSLFLHPPFPHPSPSLPNLPFLILPLRHPLFCLGLNSSQCLTVYRYRSWSSHVWLTTNWTRSST
jgi:hypothetical protein